MVKNSLKQLVRVLAAPIIVLTSLYVILGLIGYGAELGITFTSIITFIKVLTLLIIVYILFLYMPAMVRFTGALLGAIYETAVELPIIVSLPLAILIPPIGVAIILGYFCSKVMNR